MASRPKAWKKKQKQASKRPSWLYLGRLGVDFRGSGEILGAFWEHFGTWVEYQKTLKNLWFFFMFFGVLASLDGVVEASWAMSWAMLARS